MLGGEDTDAQEYLEKLADQAYADQPDFRTKAIRMIAESEKRRHEGIKKANAPAPAIHPGD
jgi:hypothetical protein